jgi:ABC-type protease/lipase transport system fused ATPase/permease subunit
MSKPVNPLYVVIALLLAFYVGYVLGVGSLLLTLVGLLNAFAPPGDF